MSKTAQAHVLGTGDNVRGSIAVGEVVGRTIHQVVYLRTKQQFPMPCYKTKQGWAINTWLSKFSFAVIIYKGFLLIVTMAREKVRRLGLNL